MTFAITLATTAIATMVNKSGWVAACTFVELDDGLDPFRPASALTAMRRIVAASYCSVRERNGGISPSH